MSFLCTNMKKFINFIFIIAVVLIFVISLVVTNLLKEEGDTVLIYHNSELFKSVPISQNSEINVGNTNTVVIENGYAYMKSASCPDKTCVHTGKIKDTSRDIICLPNKVRVEVTKKSAIDAVSG